ncbi:MAG: hypothetical protein H7123_02985 [Thermoleophilia bacterium]|nr:hypothetical protein [Thermoleophilia bacterium]
MSYRFMFSVIIVSLIVTCGAAAGQGRHAQATGSGSDSGSIASNTDGTP